MTPRIIDRPKSEQDYISERIDIMQSDLDRLKLKADQYLKRTPPNFEEALAEFKGDIENLL